MTKLHIAGSVLLSTLCGALVMGCGSSGGGGSNDGTTAAGVSTASAPTGSTGSSGATTGTGNTGNTGNTTPSTVPPTADPRYYEPHVRSTLYTYCTTCHSDTSSPASAAYQLLGFPTDEMSFQNTVDRIDLNDAEGSLLLQKATGAVTHGGGAVLRTTDIGYEWLLNWIRQGALRDQFVNAPSTFARNVRPFVTAQCSGCHNNGTGGFRSGSDLMADYNSMLSVTNAGNPTQSRILLTCDGTFGHTGGAPWNANSSERAAILKWIADGQRYTQ